MIVAVPEGAAAPGAAGLVIRPIERVERDDGVYPVSFSLFAIETTPRGADAVFTDGRRVVLSWQEAARILVAAMRCASRVLPSARAAWYFLEPNDYGRLLREGADTGETAAAR
jgi:hypothetical protein